MGSCIDNIHFRVEKASSLFAGVPWARTAVATLVLELNHETKLRAARLICSDEAMRRLRQSEELVEKEINRAMRPSKVRVSRSAHARRVDPVTATIDTLVGNDVSANARSFGSSSPWARDW